MKQAILITAYKDFEQLITLVNFFDNDFNIYIHIDKKSHLSKQQKKTLLEKYNVRYLGFDYVVNWGGRNHLKAYLKLSETALNHQENIFFHLITGQDYPIKTLAYFKKFITNHQHKDYIFCDKMPNTQWENGGWDRLCYYNFYDIFNAKKHLKWINLCIKIQKAIGFKRSLKKSLPIYSGPTYWSLSRATLELVLNYTHKKPALLNRLKHTFCAEEFYFQTIIMNSNRSNNVDHDYLRYIDWESGKGGYPAFLDEDDFESMMNSNKLFARKIDMRKNKLIPMLIKKLGD